MQQETRPFAPYAPAKNVLAVVGRFRDRGLPDELTLGALETIGIPPGNAPRTLAALRFLGLIDESGKRTPVFERLRQVGTDDYPAAFGDIVRTAYEPVFKIVNPAADEPIRVSDAFRQFEPQAQREKMLSLFWALCAEAGIVPEEGRPRAPRRLKGRVEGRRVPRVLPEARVAAAPVPDLPDGGTLDLRSIYAAIQQLPRDGRWTMDKRGRWLKLFEAALDFTVAVVEPDQPGEDD